MISEVKDILAETLVKAGIARERIARNVLKEQEFATPSDALPVASLITDPGRFEVPDHRQTKAGEDLYLQVRTRRVMPIVVKIIAKDEAGAGGLISRFIAALPFFWEYEGIEGDVEPVKEKHSDHDSQMSSRYEAVVVVEFAVDVGKGAEAKRIISVEGEGKYERWQ